MIYLTEYEIDGQKFCGCVNASSWTEAELIVKQTGKPGEKVVGTLEMEIEFGDN